MRVIGTAGHVDHGKSTLVKKLTGIDPDRLAEEKAREMTIELGFAWLTLPDGEDVGIVDVPGHRDFIENMLAGVGSIDAVLLVIAADEGVMPQTREHLAILDLLGIENGLIVLSKIDMVSEADWLDLVEQDILDVIQGTTLENAEIVRVSAYTGEGIPQLVDRLAALLADIPRRPDYNQPRLSIDRVFTISGFGTVVTGTLLGGSLHIGDEVVIEPAGLRGRIRGLQSHKQSEQTAHPGSRTAVNVSGIDKRAVARGDMLALPGQVRPTVLADVRFRYLEDAGKPLKHNAQVKVFSGAAETTAAVRLLDAEILAPGAEGWLQLRLDQPLPLTAGDRFILRRPSPPQTIGGGVIVNPNPGRRWRRFQTEVIRDLQTRMQGSPSERVAHAAEKSEPVSRAALQKETGYPDSELDVAISAALAERSLITLPDGAFLAASSFNAILRRIENEVTAFHAAAPLRPGMPREELRSRIGVKGATLQMLLGLQATIVDEGHLLRMAGHEVHFTPEQQAQIETLAEQMRAAPYTPPSYVDASAIVGTDVLRALIERGDIVQIQSDIILARDVYEEMIAGALEIIDTQGSVSAAALRDRFGTSRKYAIGLLEHTDSAGITKRVGDERVRGRQA